MLFASFVVAGCVALSFALPFDDSSSLPVSSCDVKLGKVCIPDACHNLTCSLIKDFICIADRCGCEARFFKFKTKNQMYRDVTSKCGALEIISAFANFSTSHHDDDASASSAEQLLKLFRSINLLTNDALRHIAIFLKKNAEKDPTDENVQLFGQAVNGLKALADSKVLYDSIDERRMGNFFANAVHGLMSKANNTRPTVEKARNKMQATTSHDVLLMDDETGEVFEAKLDYGPGFRKELEEFMKKAKGSDETQGEDEVQHKDTTHHTDSLPAAVEKAGTKDIKIAGATFSNDGPFTDALSDWKTQNDIQERFDWKGLLGGILGAIV